MAEGPGGGCQSVTTLSSGLPRHEMTSAVNVALNKHSTNQRGGGAAIQDFRVEINMLLDMKSLI